MICPVCNRDMVVIERNRIELDYCTKCRGVWFDSGELELLLGTLGLDSSKAFLDNLTGSPETKTSEKKRSCPICRQKMKKTNAGEQPHILIDVCRSGDGLWFDGNELGELVKQLAKGEVGKPDIQHKLIEFLGETFQGAGK